MLNVVELANTSIWCFFLFLYFIFSYYYCFVQQLVKIINMGPSVQRVVDAVWMENSVTLSTELARMGVRLGITNHAVKKVYWLDKKHSEKSPHSVFFHERIKLPQALCQDKLKILMKSVYTFNLFIYKKKILWRYVQNFHFWDSFRMPSKLIRKKLFAKLQWELLSKDLWQKNRCMQTRLCCRMETTFV